MIAVGAIALAVFKPVVLLCVILVFVVVAAWLLPKIVRRLRRMMARAGALFRGEPAAPDARR